MQSVTLVDAIRGLVNRDNIPENLIYRTVEEALLAAYEKKYHTTDNAVTKIDDLKGQVYLYSKKQVVKDKDFDDIVSEISISKAKQLNPNCEIGDEVLVEIKFSDFGRIEIQKAKQIVKQKLSEIRKDKLYSEYINKVGELISGEFQRERFGTIFVDLGKTEAILPVGEQSPRERYSPGERIRAIILEVKQNNKGTSIILSRASNEFIRKLFELEVPEISDEIVEIKGIVRDVGSRTKISVYSTQIDPVGACVGMKGIRIQSIVKELEGEKIDIIPYNNDERTYIKNALLPARIDKVNIINKEESKAVAIVEDDQLSLAIGKKGKNVRLASELTGWNIDVITHEKYKENPSEYSDVFRMDWDTTFEAEEETHDISLLEGLSVIIIDKLKEVGITTIENLIDTPKEELAKIPGIGENWAEEIYTILKDTVEIVDDEIETKTQITEEEEEEEETTKDEEIEKEKETKEDSKELTGEEEQDIVHDYDYEYECPECGNPINEMIILCPKCGIELEFE
jgi:transcription termination/antitermination protein NusA